jgi:hypothetical protein
MFTMSEMLGTGGAGLAHGYLVNNDMARGRIEMTKQWAFWGEIAAIAVGMFLPNVYRGGRGVMEFSEGVGFAGATLLADRAGRQLLRVGPVTTPYSVAPRMGAVSPMALAAGGGVGVQGAVQRIMPVLI